LNQILKRQTSPFHYGSKFPAVMFFIMINFKRLFFFRFSFHCTANTTKYKTFTNVFIPVFILYYLYFSSTVCRRRASQWNIRYHVVVDHLLSEMIVTCYYWPLTVRTDRNVLYIFHLYFVRTDLNLVDYFAWFNNSKICFPNKHHRILYISIKIRKFCI
jgi:hypothetical protein